MANDEMMAQISGKDGFIAALDQSGGSTPGALRAYGIADSAYSDVALGRSGNIEGEGQHGAIALPSSRCLFPLGTWVRLWDETSPAQTLDR
jgi:hypothetical protein